MNTRTRTSSKHIGAAQRGESTGRGRWRVSTGHAFIFTVLLGGPIQLAFSQTADGECAKSGDRGGANHAAQIQLATKLFEGLGRAMQGEDPDEKREKRMKGLTSLLATVTALTASGTGSDEDESEDCEDS